MKSFISILIGYFLLLLASAAFGQEASKNKIVITGVRFAYPLVEKWIDAYKKAHPDTDIKIEPRSNIDPASYDLLIEAYEPDAAVKETRDYLYLARYILLPVANAKSPLAATYAEKGLTSDLFKQIYFNDVTADKKKRIDPATYLVYTRLQKAGAPITFARYFGYEQTNIKGKAIQGADEHLIKALLKDTLGISYSVPSLLYDLKTRRPVAGLSILPVDTDDNGRLGKDENIFASLDDVLVKAEETELKNVPIEYLHLSIRKNNSNSEAQEFLRWVVAHGQDTLHEFGFLKPEPRRYEQEKKKFEEVALN